MADGNSGGRLDRIEALLDKLAERQREFQIIQEHDHEEFKLDHKRLMTWQTLMHDIFEKAQADAERERKRLDTLSEKTDRRIAELVSAIGKLLEQRPRLSGSS